MTYKDRAFCQPKLCINTACDRRLTAEDIKYLRKTHIPVLYSDFEPTCPDYIGALREQDKQGG